jgi:hypothetical protein
MTTLISGSLMVGIQSRPLPEPSMSVVLIDLHGNLGETLRALRAQGPAEQLEIVLVAPEPAVVADRYPELADFGAVRTVSCRPSPTTGEAKAAGMHAARAPIVTYIEDHAFPEPGWMEARLAAHTAGAAAVGTALRNANPATSVSWAHFTQCFGPFAMPVAGGRSANLPWHQSSYRRDLLPQGPELETLLESEGLLHAHLHRSGHTLVLESAAVAAHIGPSRMRALLSAAWNGGRVWGAGRARHERWSRARRAAHAALFPHTALRELRLRLADVERVIPSRRRTVVPLMALAIAVHSVGEAIGVLFGARQAVIKFTDIEFNRRAYLSAQDEPGTVTQR